MSIYINGKELATTDDFGKTFSNIYKDAASNYDLNDLVNNTIYADNFIPANAPENIFPWCFYVSIGVSDTQVQFAIEASKGGEIYRRVKNSYPSTWGDWAMVSHSHVDIYALEKRVTALEKKLGGVISPLYFTHLQELEVA